MPKQLLLPWVSVAVLTPLIVAAFIRRSNETERARRYAVSALAVSLFTLLSASLEAARAPHTQFVEPFTHWFVVDALNAVPLPLFAALALGLTILAPKRKVTPQWLAGVLCLSAATLAAYAANNLLLFVLAWAGSLAPFLVRRCFTAANEQELPAFSKAVLLASLISLIVGVALLLAAVPDWSLTAPRAGDSGLLRAAFICLMLAVFLRKGLAPAHSWVLLAFERGPLLPLTLLVNGHLGAFLIARVAIPLLPDIERAALPLLGDLGLATAAYTALLALVERQPRRLLALLSISQASFLLVGLESNNADGIAGALVHWQVVTVATAMLAAVITGLEARLGVAFDTRQFYGLAVSAPRLAVFFAAGGLALVGLPLTLGFCAEDLLLHGTLATHPQLGVVLPIVTALNAYHVMRLFAALFLGKPGAAAHGLADALPRERWVLTAALVFLLLGGLAPAALVRLSAAAAERLAAYISVKHEEARLR